jgi:MFS family permease
LITKEPMNALERRAVIALAGLYSFRMLGLFMVLPLLALYSENLVGSTAVLLGLALGVYGLAQALLQIPFGLVSDRIGRKPVIIFGLLLFAAGSLLAAQADTIYGVILGRLMQGAGAIASTVMALVADLTRDEQRTKAMAVVGMSIGASFAVALVVGPVLASYGGLALVFNVTAGLAFTGIVIVWRAVPTPAQLSAGSGETGTVPSLLARSFFDLDLVRLNVSVFVLHFILMAGFLVLPMIMERQLGLHRDQHWMVYLPTLLLSIMGMVPLMIVGERKGHLKGAFLGAIVLLAVSQGVMGNTRQAIWFYAGLWLFFVGFNYLEATLPSLVSKTVYAGGKGTALGVYSSFQFMGAFAGGAVGGLALQYWGAGAVFSLCIILALLWILVIFGMRAPRNLANVALRLPAQESEWDQRLAPLRAAAGVEEMLLLREQGTVYLKVDDAVFDRTLLAEAGP